MAKFAEKATSESQALSGCTLRQPSWVSRARKRSLGDRMIRDSRLRGEASLRNAAGQRARQVLVCANHGERPFSVMG
jgi:hypothetical protein